MVIGTEAGLLPEPVEMDEIVVAPGERADVIVDFTEMDGEEIVKWQKLIRDVILARHVQDYIVRLTLATHPEGPFALPVTNQYLRWGSSPRGAQTLALAAKVWALLEGRFNVSFQDVRRVYLPALSRWLARTTLRRRRCRRVLNHSARTGSPTTGLRPRVGLPPRKWSRPG